MKKKAQKTIPYSTQSISSADERAVLRALRSRWLTQGPAIPIFEQALAKKVGTRYAIALNSGTAALHAAYAVSGVGEGDEVIVPAMTFAATANAALYLGAKPVFADVTLADGLIDPKDVAKKITKKTKAIVAVDYGGRPAPLRELRVLAKKHKLTLIEDGAQSLGASYRGKKIGSIADMTTFSFHPVKSITTGEGGAVTTNDAELAKRVRNFRTHGITKDTADFSHTSHGPWYQEMHNLGFNYRLTDIQAVLGTSQLARLGTFIAKRCALARCYDTLLKNIPGLMLPPPDTKEVESAWHLYPIRVPSKKRRALFEALQGAGIGVQVHYIPVYLHPYYQKLGYKKGLCPNAEAFYESEISIPLFPTLTKREQNSIVKKIRNAFSV